MKYEEIKREVMKLNEPDQARLYKVLNEHLVSEAWKEEIKVRRQAIESGKSKLVDFEAVKKRFPVEK